MTTENSASPTSLLREEHQLILQVAHRLNGLLATESETGDFDYDTVEKCITFFRLFADACHHSKEEEMLFPALQAEGVPRESGPIAVMLYEHDLGRTFVQAMANSIDAARTGDTSANIELRSGARAFIDLIVAHISKEDGILFMMADGMITGPECQTLCAQYEENCARSFEGRTKEDLEELAAGIL